MWAWVVVLAAVLLLADVTLRRVVSRQAEQRLTALGDDVSVGLPGSASGLRLLTGSAHRVEVEASDVPLGVHDAAIARLGAELTDVTLPVLGRRLSAATATFRAELDGPALSRIARLPRQVARIELRDGELQVVTIADLRVASDVSARDGELVIRPTGRLAELAGIEVTVGLDDLPAGAIVERASVQGSTLVVSGPLDGDHLLPQG